jgi:outer membrane biosynthesis protein TonB
LRNKEDKNMRKRKNITIAIALAAMMAIIAIIAIPRTKALENPAAPVSDTANETVTETVTEVTEPSEEHTEETTPETTEEPIDETAEPTKEVVEQPEATKPVETQPTSKPTTKPQAEVVETKPAHTHNYSSKITQATCTTKGYTTNTCACGDSYTSNEIVALGHDYKSVVTAPAVGSVGFTTNTCKRCGDSYIDNYTDALQPAPTEPAPTVHQHSYSAVKVVKPNCTTEGYTTYKCSTCGESYNGTYTAKTAHTYKQSVVAPTAQIEGYTLHMCTGCGDSYKDSYTAKVEVVKPMETAPATPSPAKPVTPVVPVEPTPTEPTEPSKPVHNCDCSDGHDHEEIVVGRYTYVYCSAVSSPMKGEDGFTVFYPWSFY